MAATAILLLAAPASAAIITVGSGSTLVGNRAANLIANGSFEQGLPATTGSYASTSWTGPGPHTGGSPGGTGTVPTGWTASFPTGAYGWWGRLDMDGVIGTACGQGSNCLYFGNWWASASSTPTVDATGRASFAAPPSFTNESAGNNAPVVLAQTIALAAGESYLLDFWTSGEDFYTARGLFGLTIGSETVFLTNTASPLRYQVTFTADAASTTIAFTNWGHLRNFGNATELVLDDVILNRTGAAPVGVAEPGALALFGSGLLGFGLVARRRRLAA